jgi:hypothetical protein
LGFSDEESGSGRTYSPGRPKAGKSKDSRFNMSRFTVNYLNAWVALLTVTPSQAPFQL